MITILSCWLGYKKRLCSSILTSSCTSVLSPDALFGLIPITNLCPWTSCWTTVSTVSFPLLWLSHSVDILHFRRDTANPSPRPLFSLPVKMLAPRKPEYTFLQGHPNSLLCDWLVLALSRLWANVFQVFPIYLEMQPLCFKIPRR